jgi:hypothetical protein
MAEESGVVVRRRSRAEIARLAGLYGTSGMGRSEFCRSHGISLSTLSRHLNKPSGELGHKQPSRLVAVELAVPSSSGMNCKQASGLTVWLSKGRRVEVSCGFDRETLVQLVTMLERV